MAEMTMVERVARAISVADLNITAKTYPEMPMERMAEHLRTVVENGHYDAMARAAIEAMREPSLSMQHVGCDVAGNYEVARKCYRSMIGAALNEEVAG